MTQQRDQYDPPAYSPVTFRRSAKSYSEIDPPPWGEEHLARAPEARRAAPPPPAARHREPYRAPRPAGAARPKGRMLDLAVDEVKHQTEKAFRVRLNLSGRVFELWLPKAKVIRTGPAAFRIPQWLATKEGLPL